MKAYKRSGMSIWLIGFVRFSAKERIKTYARLFDTESVLLNEFKLIVKMDKPLGKTFTLSETWERPSNRINWLLDKWDKPSDKMGTLPKETSLPSYKSNVLSKYSVYGMQDKEYDFWKLKILTVAIPLLTGIFSYCSFLIFDCTLRILYFLLSPFLLLLLILCEKLLAYTSSKDYWWHYCFSDCDFPFVMPLGLEV